jgi:hypothetical protein
LSYVERTFAGVRDLGEFELLLVAGAAEMPATVLFGRSPAGLNATGESDLDTWLAVVGAWQTSTYGPPVTQVVQLVARTQGAQDPDGWGVVWPNLEPLSLKATAELEKIHAETDAVRVERLGMPLEVVMRHRYGGGEYRTAPPLMTDDELDDLTAQREADEEAAEEAAKRAAEEPGAPPVEGVTPPQLAPFAAKMKAAAEEPAEDEPAEDDEE